MMFGKTVVISRIVVNGINVMFNHMSERLVRYESSNL